MPPTNILFIGNSYTGRNDLPGLIRQIAASVSIEMETRAVLANGMPLRAHWNKGDAVREMEQRRWDYVALQEQSTLPLKNPARMRESVILLDQAIRSHGSRTVLYMTWARQDAPERQKDFAEVYGGVGREIGALVVPVGLAWATCLQKHPEIALHDSDKSHPTVAGSYLAACVFFATLFHQSPAGLWAPAKGLPAEQAQALQAIASSYAAGR